MTIQPNMLHASSEEASNWADLAHSIKPLGKELGFQQVEIIDFALEAYGVYLQDWISNQQRASYSGSSIL
jgi:hypothetical protein